MIFTDIFSERAIRTFKKVGFLISKIGGKHIGMADGRRKIIIPRHRRLNPYTLKAIIRDAGLTDEEFQNLRNFNVIPILLFFHFCYNRKY